MNTTLDIVDIVFQHIKASSLTAAISGGIYKQVRPVNSVKEDVVINSLPVTNQQLQQAIVNVNIHVPNKLQNINGVQDNSQPDYPRLKALAAAAKVVLTEVWSGDYNFDIQQQGLFEDDQSKSYYVNFRVEIILINLN